LLLLSGSAYLDVHRGMIFGMGMDSVLAVFFFDLFVQGDGFCGHRLSLGGFTHKSHGSA